MIWFKSKRIKELEETIEKFRKCMYEFDTRQDNQLKLIKFQESLIEQLILWGDLKKVEHAEQPAYDTVIKHPAKSAWVELVPISPEEKDKIRTASGKV